MAVRSNTAQIQLVQDNSAELLSTIQKLKALADTLCHTLNERPNDEDVITSLAEVMNEYADKALVQADY